MLFPLKQIVREYFDEDASEVLHSFSLGGQALGSEPLDSLSSLYVGSENVGSLSLGGGALVSPSFGGANDDAEYNREDQMAAQKKCGAICTFHVLSF